MIILTLRTDRPLAELGIYDDNKQLAYLEWEAHRILADTIHQKLEEILNKLSISLDDIEGIVCFKGPGSFTGLRIGLSVANALAYTQNISIITENGDEWVQRGIKKLLSGENEKIAIPEYGSEPKTTKPKS